MQLVKDVSLTDVAEMQVIVRGPMMHVAGRCDFVRRSSAIGGRRIAVLHLVVLDCRGSIAILTGRPHVLRYVYASEHMRVILEYSRGLRRGRFCRGIVHGNVHQLQVFFFLGVFF